MNAVLLRELENLRRAPIESLRVKYREVFAEEPRSKHKEQLFRRLAWRMQTLVQGELPISYARRCVGPGLKRPLMVHTSCGIPPPQPCSVKVHLWPASVQYFDIAIP